MEQNAVPDRADHHELFRISAPILCNLTMQDVNGVALGHLHVHAVRGHPVDRFSCRGRTERNGRPRLLGRNVAGNGTTGDGRYGLAEEALVDTYPEGVAHPGSTRAAASTCPARHEALPCCSSPASRMDTTKRSAGGTDAPKAAKQCSSLSLSLSSFSLHPHFFKIQEEETRRQEPVAASL